MVVACPQHLQNERRSLRETLLANSDLIKRLKEVLLEMTGCLTYTVNLSCSERLSPYRAVNALNVGCKNQSVNVV